ncbi:MAG: tetratricopeptide repeat protein [Rhodobacterales bacterium]|jgi:tetratricopeptide (TPR) repeat protein|nr:tetratricopeptide repeat protein [Rhodobacterales bacterium]
MIKQLTLILSFTLLYSNNIFAYNVNNECEKQLNKGKFEEALKAASSVKDKYDSNFCKGKANFRLRNNDQAIMDFEIAEKEASIQADQMQAILFKGITQRDSGDFKGSNKTFIYGFQTAELGNSKYLQYEHRFLYQLGINMLRTKEFLDAQDYYTRALVLASNDNERAVCYEGLAQTYFYRNKASKAVEYGLRATLMFQKTGMLGEYADSSIELSRYYYLDKNQTKAIETLKKLEKFCIDNGGEYYLAKTLIAQVELYTKIGDEKAAAESKKNAEIVMQRLGIEDFD